MRLPPTLDVWVVGDCEETITSIAASFVAEPWVTISFASVESFKRQLIKSEPGCIVVHCGSNYQRGRDLIRHAHATTWPAPAILVVEGATLELTKEAEQAGILDVISPPVVPDQLRSIVAFARQLALEWLREFYRSE